MIRTPRRTPLAELLREADEVASLGSLHGCLGKMLAALRRHLQMDVAFVSQFEDGCRVFRSIDSGLEDCPIQIGGSNPLDESYCQRVVDGRLPELMNNAAENPEALRLEVTRALPVGAHLSVPIILSSGEVFGTLCCFSLRPDYSLCERDLSVMRAMSDVIAGTIERDLLTRRRCLQMEARIRSVMSGDALQMLYQPIRRLPDGRSIGFEALARFHAEPVRSPEHWFREAAEVGLGGELEIKAAALALEALARLPDEVYVSVNLSPQTICGGDLLDLLEALPIHRVVVEVTEHAVTTDYAELVKIIDPLRKQGLRLAVDDAGAGYASFRHILSLKPDIIKLDIGLTRDIDRDASRRSLATALIGFSNATGCQIIAEGVEREEELSTLQLLGVGEVQGFYMGEPMPLESALELARHPAEMTGL